MFFFQQKTLKRVVSCRGIGVHSNQPIEMVFKPAPVNHGIVFIRRDIRKYNQVPARYDFVQDVRFCTVLTNENNISISTVEHVMAALAAYSITNLIIEVSGSEIPIMDGSAQPFIKMIKQAGISNQRVAKSYLKVLKKVEIHEDFRFASLEPAEDFIIDYHIDFGKRQNLQMQSHIFHFTQENFVNTIAAARSFGFLEDAQRLWSLGLARGSSFDNAVVIDQGKVINPDGMRYKNEMVRHKILDALGDLALAGMGIQGRLTTYNGGHELNNRILRQLMATPGAFKTVSSLADSKDTYLKMRHNLRHQELFLSA